MTMPPKFVILHLETGLLIVSWFDVIVMKEQIRTLDTISEIEHKCSSDLIHLDDGNRVITMLWNKNKRSSRLK
jgi:hypothetical protein